MADPTIQTFCCHHSNSTDMAIMIMQEFNTDVYNTVCMLSSSIGILGAVYQVRETLIQFCETLMKLFFCRYFQGRRRIFPIDGFLCPEEERSSYGLQLQIYWHHWVVTFISCYQQNMTKYVNRKECNFTSCCSSRCIYQIGTMGEL